MQTEITTTRKRYKRTGNRVVATFPQRKGRTMTRSTLGFTLTDVLVAIAIFGTVVIAVIPNL